MNWDVFYMLLAGDVSFKSKDPRTKVGAVLVDDKKRLVSIGYNGFPRGVIDSVNVYEDSERKWYRCIHAETNALLFAERQGHTMYCTHPPCGPCMAAMIQKGVRCAIWDQVKMISYVESHQEALQMGLEVQMEMYEWNGKERLAVE